MELLALFLDQIYCAGKSRPFTSLALFLFLLVEKVTCALDGAYLQEVWSRNATHSGVKVQKENRLSFPQFDSIYSQWALKSWAALHCLAECPASVTIIFRISLFVLLSSEVVHLQIPFFSFFSLTLV